MVETAKFEFYDNYFTVGGEFKALFMSTVEALDSSGCSFNPTKSLCSPSVFNTAITRAKSLIVAIGNPYTLMSMEEKMDTDKLCWAHYLRRCFETQTVVAGEGINQESLQELRHFVDQKLQMTMSLEQAVPQLIVRERVEEKPKPLSVSSKPLFTPVSKTTSVQIRANNSVQVGASKEPSKQGASPMKEVSSRSSFRVSTFVPSGKDIYIGLSLQGATNQNTNIKITGPFLNESQALSNPQSPQQQVKPDITETGNEGCILRLPPLHQAGVFAVIVNSYASSGMFFVNIFDPYAVRLRGQVTCTVNQEQQWVADCTRAGPGILVATVNNTNIPVNYSSSGQHVIAFTPISAGLYTLEVTYNGHDTGNTQRFNVQ